MSRFREFIEHVNSIPPEERYERMRLERVEHKRKMEASIGEYIANGGKFITEEDIESGKAAGGWLD